MIEHRLEMDLRYGNQLVTTAVSFDINRIHGVGGDVLNLIRTFSDIYSQRYGQGGSAAPEAGIRVQTIRVASYVNGDTVEFDSLHHDGERTLPVPIEHREVHFVGHPREISTAVYDAEALDARHVIPRPSDRHHREHDLSRRAGLAPRTLPAVPSGSSRTSAETPGDNVMTAVHDDLARAAAERLASLDEQEQQWVDEFMDETTLFLGPPDPEIMRSHHITSRSEMEEECIAKGVDPLQVDRIRKRLAGALDEGFEMCEAMGAAPGAKWG